MIVVGLGCEITNLGDILDGAPGDSLSIQAAGGTSRLVAEAVRRIDALLPRAYAVERIIAVASGERTCSERLGYGEEEFCPWDLGVML